MIIGYDAKRAAANKTGLGNYSRAVIEYIARNSPSCDIRLFLPNGCRQDLIEDLINIDNINTSYPSGRMASLSASLWRSSLINNDIKRNNIDLYHGLSNEIPFGITHTKIKTVVTIHDLIFMRCPEYYNFIDRHIYTAKARYACMNADHIIAVSEKTKKDIVHYFDINPDKITTVYQSCSDIFRKKVTDNEIVRIRHKYALPKNYILNVGSIEKRKNAMEIVKSLSGVSRDVSLVIVGKNTPYTESIRKYMYANSLFDRVKILHNVPDNDLPAIYQGAKVFVYPSFYEGFGIPIIEAIHSGLPVIAAKGSCLEESAGNGALYIEPTDTIDLRDKINLILTHPNVKSMLKAKGEKHIARFDNDIQSEKILNIYKELVPNR